MRQLFFLLLMAFAIGPLYAADPLDPLEKFRFNFRNEENCYVCFEKYEVAETLAFSSCLHQLCQACLVAMPHAICGICRKQYDKSSLVCIEYQVLKGNDSIMLWPLAFNDEEKSLAIWSELKNLVKNGSVNEEILANMLKAKTSDGKTLQQHAREKNWKKLDKALLGDNEPKLDDDLLANEQPAGGQKKYAYEKLWPCHWFPKTEIKPGGCRTNNLYAKGGPLDKLDQITGKKARQYEWDYHHRAYNTDNRYFWYGHCHEAAIVACILAKPKYSVTLKNRQSETIVFTPHDAEGLLVKCVSSLETTIFGYWNEHNLNILDPVGFLRVIEKWGASGESFILDEKCPYDSIWSTPYDRVTICESDKSKMGYDAASGGARFYYFTFESSAFDKIKNCECFIDDHGNSGWSKSPDIARYYRHVLNGDFTDRRIWQNKCLSNPEIDLHVVYEIFMKSLE